MARRPRLCVPGWAHLVGLDAAPGQWPFHDDDDRDAFVDALRAARADAGGSRLRVHGWTLLRERVRLLLVPGDAAALGGAMQSIGRRFVAAHRRRHGGAGPLWAGRFRAAALEPGAVALDAMLLVDAAAFDAGLVADPMEHRWSSARHHAGVERSAWLDDAPEWWALGNTPFERDAAYLARLRAGLAPAVSRRLRDASRLGWIVGVGGARRTLDGPLRLEGALTRRGRPPRSDAS